MVSRNCTFKKSISSLSAIVLMGSQAFVLAEKPNIILVMADDQGWGDTGFNGHPILKTPNMDAMAKSGLVLNQFYAGAPVCSPTRGSVLTGRNNNRVDILNHGHFMADKEYTIANALKGAGYVTGHFGKWHIGSVQAGSKSNPTARGYDEWIIGANFFDTDPYLSNKGKVKQYKGDSSEIVIEHTIDFLKKHKDTGKPMFAVAWYSSPHVPHAEKPKSNPDMYKGVKGEPYFSEITALDETLGTLRKALREMKIADNTIVWYCSDNGGLMKESSGGRAKKGSIYEGGLRVPSIIEWPDKIKPSESNIPSSTSDMMPTLLAMAGVKAELPHPIDGESLAGLLDGSLEKRAKGIGFWRHARGGSPTWNDKLLKAIMEAQKAGKPSPFPERIKGKTKIEQHPLDKFPGHSAWLEYPWKLHRIEKNGSVRYELYHLKNDPMEEKNLIDSEKKRAAEMKQAHQAWLVSVVKSLNGEDYKK